MSFPLSCSTSFRFALHGIILQELASVHLITCRTSSAGVCILAPCSPRSHTMMVCACCACRACVIFLMELSGQDGATTSELRLLCRPIICAVPRRPRRRHPLLISVFFWGGREVGGHGRRSRHMVSVPHTAVLLRVSCVWGGARMHACTHARM